MIESLQNIIDGEVYTDPIRTGLLSTDGSIYSVKPAAVVYPVSTEDVVRTVRFAGDNGLSVHPRGAGSGLCGSALGSGIVLDFSKYMNRLLGIDFENNWFECEPGYRLGELEVALKGSGLFFPPDPSSGEYATFGGMYGTNASGSHSVKYGNVSDYILDAQIVLSSGRVVELSDIFNTAYENLPESFQQIYDLYVKHRNDIETAYPAIRCNTSGYNLRGMVKDGCLDLTRLFAGSEGTLGVVTRLKFRLISRPAHDVLVIAFFSDILSSVRAVQHILPLGPSGIEIMDKSLLNLAKGHEHRLRKDIPDGVDNVLLIEFDSQTLETCIRSAKETCRILESGGLSQTYHLAQTSREKENFWAIRKAAVPILYKLKGQKKILALIEDAAVPTDKLVTYFEGIHTILNRYQVDFVIYGHIAKGLLHIRPLLDLKNIKDIDLLKPISDGMFELIYSLGGTVSGEHGDGRLRSAYIYRQYPGIFPLFQKIRDLQDPERRFNPDILTSANPDLIRQHLRYGKSYQAADIRKTHLLWPEGFMHDIETCHGCSRCTTVTSATRMCPVYKITRDESASPKAKANLLRLLISGVIDNNERFSEKFMGIINQCIQCGSCFHECPSGVNIPKMVIETRAAYRSLFGVSLQDNIMIRAEQIGETFQKLPPFITSVLRSRWIKAAGKSLTGISSRRNLLPPAKQSLFKSTLSATGNGRPRIVYFPGCFAAYFRPSIGKAVLSVLTSMRMTVLIPGLQHCCGLPMITRGLSPRAHRKIEDNFQGWGSLLESADYIVVSCSSCGWMLSHGWSYLADSVFVRDVRSKLIHISRLVNRYVERLQTRPSETRLFYHAPCHLKIQPEPDSSLQMLSGLDGVVIEHPSTHCCGMAGTWGLSTEHVDLSLDIGADLFQKMDVSDADEGVTDCPTCAVQMAQFSSMPIRHPIEVMAEHHNNFDGVV